ncbi:hypothetical protein [Microvirga massiliensis]|nr:hypothetical protein [Microvirga massiliensis]
MSPLISVGLATLLNLWCFVHLGGLINFCAAIIVTAIFISKAESLQ